MQEGLLMPDSVARASAGRGLFCSLRRLGLRAAGAVALCALAPSAASAATQLSDGHSYSDINFDSTLPLISPDGQYAVYKQDAVTDGANELWSVRLDGTSPPVRISDVLTPGRFVSFAISSDSTRVVFSADQDTDGQVDLFSVLIGTGGDRRKLNGSWGVNPTFKNVAYFAVPPLPCTRVVYVADAVVDQRYEIYSVPIDGGTAIRLNHDLSSDYDIESFEVSPDGQTLVYRAGRDANNFWELYSVPIAGPREEAVKISRALTTGMSVLPYFKITPNSNTVLYLADVNVDESYDLYRTSIHGPGEVSSINTGVAAGYSIDPTFVISNDGSRVVYRAGTPTTQIYQLFSTPISPGSTVRLNGALGAGEDVEAGFAVSADSSKVVYRSDEDVDTITDLYSVPIAGGTPTRLNPALVGNGDVLDLAISPNSARVVYIADQNVDTLNELFSVPIGGGAVTKLNRSLGSGGDVQNFRISADGTWVVYGADQDVDTVDELLGVPIAGGTVLNLNGPLVNGGDVVLHLVQGSVYEISAANSRDVVYAADETVDNEIELYTVSIGGPPSAPTAVVATPGDTQVSVTFAAPGNNGGSPITGYTVTPSPATVGWVDNNAGSTALTHVIANLTNGTPYTFTVRATNINGTGDPSAPSNSATPATVPSAPSAVAAVARNHGADVTFAASASNGGSTITGYTVISSPAGGIDLTQGTTNLKHFMTGLTNGTPYTFTVVAQNAMGTSPASAASSAVTPGCAPGPVNLFCDGLESNDTSQWSFASALPGIPTSVVAAGGNGQATVTFVGPVEVGNNAVTGYTVTSNPAGGIDSNAGAIGLSHVVTGLANGTSYTFTVRATNANGEGAPSAPSNAVTPATVPGAPTAAFAVAGDSSATVTFLPPVDDGGSVILGYTVVSSPAGGIDANAGTTAVSHAISNLSNGTEYTFTVTATNAAGTGDPSSASNAVTPAP